MHSSLPYLILIWSGAAVTAALPLQLINPGYTNSAAAGDSRLSAMTPDARYVVFVSDARNLTAHGGRQKYGDIFVRDTQTQQTTLASINMSNTGGGDDDSAYASISADGRYVVFASAAGNLIANDTNGVSDVFRRDLQLGRTELVSVALSGGVPAASAGRRLLGASKPVMTADGRYVAFESCSTEFVSNDTNQNEKIFLRDMQNGTIVLAGDDARWPCWSPSLSSNAAQVAFLIGTGGGGSEVSVRDLQTGITRHYGAFTGELNRCFEPVLAPDGQFVVFKAKQIGLGSLAPIHVMQGTNTVQASPHATNSQPGTAPSLSSDGRWLAFEENGNIYLRDFENRTNILVSANPGGGPPIRGTSHTPSVSADGGHVAFLSSATDLISGLPSEETNAFRLYVRDVNAATTRLVSRDSIGLPVAIGAAAEHLISHDGARVAFDTDVSTLIYADNNDAFDVFVQDVAGGMALLISAEHPQRRAVTGIRSMTLKPNAVSGNGSRVAFAMSDNRMIAPDTNRNMDVFVCDVGLGALMAQSPDSNGVFLTTRRALNPFLSTSGTHTVFETWEPAGELWSGSGRLFWKPVDSAAAVEIEGEVTLEYPLDWSAAMNSNGTLVAAGRYIYDMVAGTRRSVPGDTMRRPLFSPNEEWVVAKRGAGAFAGMLADHVRTNKTVLVTKDSTGRPLTAMGGAFSGSGRYFVFDFASGAINGIYRYDFESDATRLISTNGSQPAIDFAGNLIAFASARTAANSPRQVYVHDVSADRSDLITHNQFATGPANGHSRGPLISGDGRYVVFVSGASDLVSGDNNSSDDIFVHDRVQRTTVMLTRSRQGQDSANALSSMPVLAADGRTVVFQSFASDLAEGDYNDERDIFIVRLGVGDSDSDGMDDDWEVAHFGGLNRDGAGDQDGDGQTDLQEFLAGTDPANSGSILRVLTITPMGGGSTTVVWSAVVGRDYVVQFKDSLEATWSNASGAIEANSGSMSFAHNSSSPLRFYRVVAVQ